MFPQSTNPIEGNTLSVSGSTIKLGGAYLGTPPPPPSGGGGIINTQTGKPITGNTTNIPTGGATSPNVTQDSNSMNYTGVKVTDMTSAFVFTPIMVVIILGLFFLFRKKIGFRF